MSQPKIVVYFKPTCGWSHGVHAVLKKYNLVYEERDILASPEYREEMVRKTGQNFSPCVEVGEEMIADIGGEGLEKWLVSHQIVKQNGDPFDGSEHQYCSIR